MYPQDLNYIHDLDNQPEIMCPGGTCIVDPFGKYVAGPVFNKEEMLIADLDMDKVIQSKIDLDVVGHYSRNDVFELKINE